MMKHVQVLLLALVGVVVLASCSTPTPVLKQAEHGVALTSQLDLELKEFRKNESFAQKALLATVASQKNEVVRLTRAIKQADLSWQATGDIATKRVVDKLSGYLSSLEQIDDDSQEELTTAAKSLEEVLAPLPSSSGVLTETQGKFADFGKEISFETRAREFKKIVDAVEKIIKENKQKMAEAATTAASSPN